MKRLVAINLIIIILFAFAQTCVFAANSVSIGGETLTDINKGIKQEDYNSLMDEGTTGTYGEDKQKNVPVQVNTTTVGLGTRIIGRIFLIVPQLINKGLSAVVDGDTFTIENAVSNKYALFNLKNIISPEIEEGNSVKSTLELLSKNVAIWFVSLRNLAIVGCFIVLIYIAIRMLTETLPLQQANYKKMIIAWVEGIILLFLLQYFFVFIVNSSNYIVSVLANTINGEDANYFETTILKNVWDNINNASGNLTSFIAYIAIYVFIVYYQIKFFFLYLARMVKFAFYIIISPLVCLTYAIDKVGDGRTQSFNRLMGDMIGDVLLQPIQLMVYLFFIFSAREILVSNPLLGLAFIASLENGEKILKNILGAKGKSLGDIHLHRIK